MSRDLYLNDKIESYLYSLDVPNSGTLAQDLAEIVEEHLTENGLNKASLPLMYKHGNHEGYIDGVS